MIKTVLLAAIAERSELFGSTIAEALAELTGCLTESLDKGEKVTWSGFRFLRCHRPRCPHWAATHKRVQKWRSRQAMA